MNGQSNNAKQFRCNYFFIRLGDKAVFLAFALGIISLLSACVSIPNPNEPPVRISDLTYQDADHNAYLWTSGLICFLNYCGDSATITRIDDINVPDEYLPWAGVPPIHSWLLEIPAGEHVIEILHKESVFLIGDLWLEKSRQTLTFMVEPNQTYHPFAADDCSGEYFWIEDWGPYVAVTETAHSMSLHNTDMTKSVVAGQRPKVFYCATPVDEIL